MKQGLIRCQENAAIQARYDAELVSVSDEPSTKTRRELDRLAAIRAADTWVYTDEQKATDAANWVEPLCIAWAKS